MQLSRADKIKAEEIAKEKNLSLDEVKKIIAAPYDFIREKSKEIVFKDGMSKEDFKKMKKNFNIPAIGKLYASYFLYNEFQERKKKKNRISKN